MENKLLMLSAEKESDENIRIEIDINAPDEDSAIGCRVSSTLALLHELSSFLEEQGLKKEEIVNNIYVIVDDFVQQENLIENVTPEEVLN